MSEFMEEKRTNGALLTFIDLLFLMIAFFTLLLFFMQNSKQLSEERMKTVQRSLQRLTGEEMEVEKALEKLEPMLERFMIQQKEQVEEEKQREAKELRRRAKTTKRLPYSIDRMGIVTYQGNQYTLRQFLRDVVTPLRKTHWIAFRASVTSSTPYGEVVKIRGILLENSNEFDTYWDNLTRE